MIFNFGQEEVEPPKIALQRSIAYFKDRKPLVIEWGVMVRDVEKVRANLMEIMDGCTDVLLTYTEEDTEE